MESFVHQIAPCRVVFGAGRFSKLGAEAERLGIDQALVLSSPTRRPLAEGAMGHLGGRAAALFDRAETDIPPESYDAALKAAQESGADGFVTVGGGSTMGLGKALAAACGHRLIAVATTYSGSEMMDNWRIGSGDAARSGAGPASRAATVIYDAELTLSLPPPVSATTGVNGIAHAVESLFAEDAGPVAWMAGKAGIRTLSRALRRIVAAPDDLEARDDALRGAFLCGGFRAGSGLEHRLAQTLRGQFNLEHSAVHSVVLPHVVAFNRNFAPQAMAAVAGALDSDDAADGLFALNDALGIPRTLSDLGMREADMPRAVDAVMARRVPNPRAYGRDDVARLIANAYFGVRAPGSTPLVFGNR